MWISNRGHVLCVRGIRLHPTGVFSNVLMQKRRHDSRKTSYWSNSDCSVQGRYRQRYPRVRVFNNFGINVGIEPSSRLPSLRHCDDVDNGLDNTCEVIRQETVLFSTPETDYIIYD